MVLWKTNGKLSVAAKWCSMIELMWAIISFVHWKTTEEARWLPLSFAIYFVSFLLLGCAVRSRVAAHGIPKSTIIAGGVFGAYFAVTSWVQLVAI